MRKTQNRCWVLGLLFAEAFVMCVLRDFLVPLSAPVRHAFEILLPGFKWEMAATLPIGVVESFLWGVYLEMVMFPVLKMFSLQHHHPTHLAMRARHVHHHAA